MLVVGFALFAFIIGDALTQGSTFFNKSKETVAGNCKVRKKSTSTTMLQ